VSYRKEKEVFILSHYSHLADVSDLNIHTFPMVMRNEKAISMLNSKVSKL